MALIKEPKFLTRKRGTMIPITEPFLGKQELKSVIEVIKSGWISSKGKFIREFEDKFAKYCGVKYGIAVSNGTVALHLALAAIGIKDKDEVIVPDLTFIATANAVKYCNAKPVFVDSHPGYWCIDPEKISQAITSKTKAIIPVHLYGHPCDMDKIMKITKSRNLYVIEDAAEAHGAEYKGLKVGSFGDISCFSFFGNKVITTGEGGMCLTNNEILAEKMRILRDHGMNPNKKYWHDTIGFNYRMTNIQAAIGVAQLRKIDKFISKRRKIAEKYAEELKELEDVKLIKLHPQSSWAKGIYWMYCILLEDNFGLSRDDLIIALGKRGIDTRPFFYPVHLMPPHRKKSENEDFSVALGLSRAGICLPSGVNLSERNIITICRAIRELSKNGKS